MVKEKFRNRGYARVIMDNLMQYLNEHAREGSFIGLFAAAGLEEFYSDYGFIERPKGRFGAGMFQMILGKND